MLTAKDPGKSVPLDSDGHYSYWVVVASPLCHLLTGKGEVLEIHEVLEVLIGYEVLEVLDNHGVRAVLDGLEILGYLDTQSGCGCSKRSLLQLSSI